MVKELIKMIVERIENNIAIIEVDDNYIELPLSVLPNEVFEGDVLQIIVDKDATINRKKEVSNKLSKLFNKNK